MNSYLEWGFFILFMIAFMYLVGVLFAVSWWLINAGWNLVY